jgi:sulfocyanin SoxE-like protein
MTYSRRVSTTGIMFVLLGCTGRSQSTPAPVKAARPGPAADSSPATAVSPPSTPDWLVIDSAARSVTLTLVTTAPGNQPSALINGYRAGEARIVVPVGWTVNWIWRNADSTSPHGLVVMVQREKIPLEGGRPAFSNAMTRMATAGLPPGQTDRTTFVAEEAGWFWLLCGVPEHALKGEWLELRVDPEAKVPVVMLKSEE